MIDNDKTMVIYAFQMQEIDIFRSESNAKKIDISSS